MRTTGEHPFYRYNEGWESWADGQPGTWVSASSLTSRDFVMSQDGSWLSVSDVLDTETWEPVYNLTVQDHHTYFVGEEGNDQAVWAHNNYEKFIQHYKQLIDKDRLLDKSKQAHPNSFSESFAKKNWSLAHNAPIADQGQDYGHGEWFAFREEFTKKKGRGLKDEDARDLWWIARDSSREEWESSKKKVNDSMKPFIAAINNQLAPHNIPAISLFYRGSIATGYKSTKGANGEKGRPWDVTSFDVDMYVKSDALHAISGDPLPGGDIFVNLSNIDLLEGFKFGQNGHQSALAIQNSINDMESVLKSIFPNNKKMNSSDFTIRVYLSNRSGLSGNKIS